MKAGTKIIRKVEELLAHLQSIKYKNTQTFLTFCFKHLYLFALALQGLFDKHTKPMAKYGTKILHVNDLHLYNDYKTTVNCSHLMP
jgi:hypothetical protein